MMRTVLLVGLATLWASSVSSQDPGRGHLLYARFCGGCHTPEIHRPKRRAVGTFAQLQSAVARWQEEVDTTWAAEDHEDLVVFLNETHYRFDCPERLCQGPSPTWPTAERGRHSPTR
jgi:hypothetical protein